ncbi:hypothetical protein DFH06DRAFT_1339965 [Mycena polygramma]|nr:hypothetical protein DFH06DRAFT_1339965 [Mycena polygramma]
MLDPSFLLQLTSELSAHSRVFTNPASPEFKELLLCWSDIGLKIPGAIIQPAREEEVAIVVKLAAQDNIAFVPKSGGHSLWSTIDGDGFRITVDEDTKQVTLQSGVVTKEATNTAFKIGLCLPLGTANTAGVIPMSGLSAISAVCGYTSDNIVFARVITAEGTLLTVNESSHPELFWGLRGADQLLALVTEITLQAYPLSVLGTDDGTLWTGAMVLAALTPLIADTSAPTVGLFLIASLPPTLETVITVLPFYLGPAAAAEAFHQPLLALGPMSAALKSVPCNRQNDSLKSGHELKAKCPDGAATAYAFEWNSYSPATKPVEQDTAFCHKGIKVWAELLSWYTDAASHKDVLRIEQETLAHFRSHYPGEQPVTYQNWSRNVPLEQLYPDAEKMAAERSG